MHLGEILIGRGFVPASGVAAALDRQRREGGRLGDNIVALGLLSADEFAAALAAVTEDTPPAPLTLSEIGIPQVMALNLMLKSMQRDSLQTVSDLAGAMRLPHQLVRELMDEAQSRKLVQALGSSSGGLLADIRFTLSADGRVSAAEAFAQSLYVGATPVSLDAYTTQLKRQTLSGEHVEMERLQHELAGLTMPTALTRKLLPAINAGRTMLLYGPPGNGKTTVASRIAGLFDQVVFIPYAVEVGGQIMRVFDPGIHRPVVSDSEVASQVRREGLKREAFDDRWVACHRPFAIAGGELTLDMLDLQYDPDLRFYEAPLHVKALNGVLLIDDFGRQRLRPAELLNRWIGPLENRVDYLKLHTGKSFSLPFDQLLVFSTNIDPRDIMDPAFLRRIPYKIRLSAPDAEEYRRIFIAEAERHGITVPAEILGSIIATLTRPGRAGLACFQPRFICAQAAEVCRSFRTLPVLTRQLAADAIANLYVDIDDAPKPEGARPEASPAWGLR